MKDDKLMGHNPLTETDLILRDTFYGRSRGTIPPEPAALKPEKPTHYKVICISMYTQDLAELDAKVAELKRRGWSKANKSHLIRLALAQLDLNSLETPHQ